MPLGHSQCSEKWLLQGPVFLSTVSYWTLEGLTFPVYLGKSAIPLLIVSLTSDMFTIWMASSNMNTILVLRKGGWSAIYLIICTLLSDLLYFYTDLVVLMLLVFVFSSHLVS